MLSFRLELLETLGNHSPEDFFADLLADLDHPLRRARELLGQQPGHA